MDGILVDLGRFVSIFLTAKTKSEVTKLHAYSKRLSGVLV